MEQQHANTDAIMDSNAMSLWCVQVQHVVFLTELFIWLKALSLFYMNGTKIKPFCWLQNFNQTKPGTSTDVSSLQVRVANPNL